MLPRGDFAIVGEWTGAPPRLDHFASIADDNIDTTDCNLYSLYSSFTINRTVKTGSANGVRMSDRPG